MKKVDEILQSTGLKKTQMRRDILQLILNSDHAVSQSFLESRLVDCDRVTIYRTLNTFENSGLIHRISGKENEISYAYCADECTDGVHHHEHIHFSCENCDKTYCLPNDTPSLSVPKGYTISQVNVLVEGVCSNCHI